MMIEEMIRCLATVVLWFALKQVDMCPVHSHNSDEVTCNGWKSNLINNLRTVDLRPDSLTFGHAVQFFLGLQQLARGNGEYLLDATEFNLARFGIEIQSIILWVTDGASPFSGKVSGCFARMKARHPTKQIGDWKHCIAHRFPILLVRGLSVYMYLPDVFFYNVEKFGRWTRYSHKVKDLVESEQIAEGQSTAKVVQADFKRWLSNHAAVSWLTDYIVAGLNALKTAASAGYEGIAQGAEPAEMRIGKEDESASFIYKNMSTYCFIFWMHAMVTLMAVFDVLSLTTQHNEEDFTTQTDDVPKAIAQIRDLGASAGSIFELADKTSKKAVESGHVKASKPSHPARTKSRGRTPPLAVAAVGAAVHTAAQIGVGSPPIQTLAPRGPSVGGSARSPPVPREPVSRRWCRWTADTSSVRAWWRR
jgi:hypothetical protein